MARVIEPASEHELTWDAIDWSYHEEHVWRLQERIFRAARVRDWRLVKNLQKLLASSRSARLISVRRVTQLNRGKLTAGVDGVTCTNGAARMQLLEEISQLNSRDYRCQPALRMYIPKPSGGQRPLGIPTVKDRVMQAIVKLALEPEWEAKFEPNSYGFRPGRRCQDAIHQIRITVTKTRKRCGSAWILDADISKCFDSIDHDALLAKVPVFRKVIRRWLKAGVVDLGVWKLTLSGTPQGGVISPLLANIALDGMERLFGIERKNGLYISPAKRRGQNKGVSVIRYADDFIISAPSREVIENIVVPTIRNFLASQGLSFSDAKTRIVHRDEGFDFLGFSLRQRMVDHQPWFVIVPAKESLGRVVSKVSEILRSNQQAPVTEIVGYLNAVLRGWGNYYRYCSASKSFAKADHLVWDILWHWCLRRHPNKGYRWVKARYFQRVAGRDWVFGEPGGPTLVLLSQMHASSRDYTKVKGYNSPYDAKLHEYWRKRGYDKLW